MSQGLPTSGEGRVARSDVVGCNTPALAASGLISSSNPDDEEVDDDDEEEEDSSNFSATSPNHRILNDWIANEFELLLEFVLEKDFLLSISFCTSSFPSSLLQTSVEEDKLCRVDILNTGIRRSKFSYTIEVELRTEEEFKNS
jgi:hypothetical protein